MPSTLTCGNCRPAPEHVRECYERYNRVVYANCERRFHGRGDDGAQEAFVRLLSREKATVPDERNWLITVGRNALISFSRRLSYSEVTSMDMSNVPDPNPGPPMDAALGELREQVGHALSLLPIADREVLLLRFMLGWKPGRIAALLAVTTRTVERRINLALRRLAETLKQIGIEGATATA